MIPRLVVPEKAHIAPDAELTASGAAQQEIRKGHLVPRHLIPANARIAPLTTVGAEAAGRTMMVPKRLVPPKAQTGVAIELGKGVAAQPVFSEALLERTSLGKRNKPAEWMASFVVHAAIVAAVMIIPLFYTQVIDLKRFEVTYLAAPMVPGPPPPPPPPAAAVAKPVAPKPNLVRAGKLTMPIAIPRAVQVPTAPEPATAPEIAAGIPGGVEGGIPGGQIGGVLGGVFGSSEPTPPPPPPAPVAAVPTGPLHVGGGVKPPKALYKGEPNYPRLALQARIQGDVEIDAVIDRDGNVIQMKAMSGPALLVSAALDAVKGWKYEPTYLNGVAYPVELVVTVHFKLSS